MREAVSLRESGRRAAECALLGVIWTACSLPVVTAGAAWSAVAEICHAWNSGEEPPLVRTFASVIRRDFLGGLGMTALGLAAAAPLLEARLSLAARLPVARAEAGALALIGAAAISVVALAFPYRAAVGAGWRDSLRAAVALVVARPWVVPLVAVALGLPAFLVIVFPAFVVFIGGPAGYAVSAVHAKAAGAELAGTPWRPPLVTAHKNGNSHLYRTAVARLLVTFNHRRSGYSPEAFMSDTFRRAR